MSFDSLPDELMLQIIHDVSWSSLRILGRCSRRFYELTKPALYSTLELPSIHSAVARRDKTIPEMLTNFLRTVLTEKNIHLTLFVKDLRASCDLETIDMSTLSDENHSYIDKTICSLCGNTNFATRWKEALLCPKGDAATALLLSLLPNLESISLDADGQNEIPYVEFVLNKANFGTAIEEPWHKLSRLDEVYLYCSSVDKELDWCVVRPFLGLKSLKSFNGEALCNDVFPGVLKSNVTDVSLHMGGFDFDSMKTFLRTFPCLKSFKYYHMGPLIEVYGLLAPDIREALSHAQNSLEELVILSDTEGEGALEVMEPIGSLSDFECLKAITFQVCLLIRDEVRDSYFFGGDENLVPNYVPKQIERFLTGLPTSLEVLTLLECSEIIFDCFDYAFTVELPPKLKEVNLIFFESETGTPERQPRRDLKDWLALEQRAADKGVVLSRAWLSRWDACQLVLPYNF